MITVLPCSVAKRHQEPGDGVRVDAVEIPGRLVGENQRRIVGEREADADALLLAAAQLLRALVRLVIEADEARGCRCARSRLAASLWPAMIIGSSTFSSAVMLGMRL